MADSTVAVSREHDRSQLVDARLLDGSPRRLDRVTVAGEPLHEHATILGQGRFEFSIGGSQMHGQTLRHTGQRLEILLGGGIRRDHEPTNKRDERREPFREVAGVSCLFHSEAAVAGTSLRFHDLIIDRHGIDLRFWFAGRIQPKCEVTGVSGLSAT